MPDRDELAELNNLKASNAQREKALNDAGVRMGNDAVVQLTAMTLKDLWIGGDPERQHQWDMAYQSKLAQALDDVERAVAEQRAEAQRPRLVTPNNGGIVRPRPG